MTEQTSSLPLPEEIREQRNIKIVRHVLNEKKDYHCKAKLHLDISIKNGDKTRIWPVIANIFKITDPSIKGYIPSKTWFNINGDIEMLFYVSNYLPERVRPFAKQDMYVTYFQILTNDIVEYDIDTTMFIDQLITEKRDVYYVIVFGSDQYDQIVATEIEE